MPRESKKARQARALEVAARMDQLYPNAPSALNYHDPFTLTIAVLLSAQTTDAAVNKVTGELFARFGTPQAMASAAPEEIEDIIRSIGFYHTKARHCVEAARMILTRFGGEVPHTMAELQELPGVGRKTANIVMNNGFGQVEGIAVDTHVYRIAHRLGFSAAGTASATEQDLLALYPREYWGPVNQQWILFGRNTCTARAPKCGTCPLADLCPRKF
jgi:endonuclease-3